MSTGEPIPAQAIAWRAEAATWRLQAGALRRLDSLPRPSNDPEDLAAAAASCDRKADELERLAAWYIEDQAALARIDKRRAALHWALGELQEAHRTADQALIRTAHEAASLAALELHLERRRPELTGQAGEAGRQRVAKDLRDIFPASTTFPAVLARLEAALANL